MEDFAELEREFRFFKEDEQMQLFEEVGSKIIELNLSDEQIIDLIFDIDAEFAHDILKVLQAKEFLSNEQYANIDRKLIDIYRKEYIRDRANGVLEGRIKAKTIKNKRLISRYEILGIYFQDTLDTKPLFTEIEVEDEFVNHLAKTHRQLCVVKTSNAIFKKQQATLEETLNSLIIKLNAIQQTL